MNRWRFVATLFGFGAIAKAQVPMGTDHKGDFNYGRLAWSRHKPKNGQCPVCGTLSEIINQAERHPAFATADNRLLRSDPQIVRCLKCNAAFWRDDEPPKPPAQGEK